MSTTMTLRLEDDVKDRLDKLADATLRSKSYLAAEAIREYVVTHEWQVDEIRAALAEADVGDFASDADVAALARKWAVGGKSTKPVSAKPASATAASAKAAKVAAGTRRSSAGKTRAR